MLIDVGAGGDWNRLNEKFDFSVVKQFNDEACISAVGEMLLQQQRGFQISQKIIAENIGTPSNFELLAQYLNSLNISDKIWIAGFFDVKYFEKVMATGIWGAVLVNRLADKSLVNVFDPFDQTNYQMIKDEFLNYLSEFICEK